MTKLTREQKEYLDEMLNLAIAKKSFWEFCLYWDNDFFTKRPFLKEVAEAFQFVYDSYLKGTPENVSVSMPPRAGKSYITSLFCAWWLGNLPKLSVMRNCSESRLYKKFSYDVRAIIKDKRFQKVFPGVELSRDKKNVDGWNLTASVQVAYFGNGINGNITGFGANIAITDDLYRDITDALSFTYNEGLIAWKQSAHNARKELNCPEIYIGTRWSKRDIIGQAIENGEIARRVEVKALVDGKSFCENVITTKDYLKIKSNTEDSIFEAVYQQNPVELKGLLFPKSELKFYNPADIDARVADYVFIPIDPADEGGDFFAAVAACLIGNKIYIPEVVFTKEGTETTFPQTMQLVKDYEPESMEFEANGGWRTLGKQFRDAVNESLPNCEYISRSQTSNKQTRILAQSTFIKRNVYFSNAFETHTGENYKHYAAFINNLTQYLREGKNKNDDAPDVLATLAAHFQKNFKHVFV